MELEIAENPSTGQESAAHAAHQLPVVKVSSAVGMGHMVRLFDQLAIHFITEWLQIMAGLQNALDDGYGIRHRLNLLQGVKDLHSFILQAAVPFLLLHCSGITKHKAAGISLSLSSYWSTRKSRDCWTPRDRRIAA